MRLAKCAAAAGVRGAETVQMTHGFGQRFIAKIRGVVVGDVHGIEARGFDGGHLPCIGFPAAADSAFGPHRAAIRYRSLKVVQYEVGAAHPLAHVLKCRRQVVANYAHVSHQEHGQILAIGHVFFFA